MTSIALAGISGIMDRIKTRDARIGIVGMGYVGLPLALLFSEERFAITGFDVDPHKVETLNKGGSYIVRIPSTEVEAAQRNGFRATSDHSRIAQMDIVLICVPTPLTEYHEPDLSFVTGTVSAMAAHLREGQLIVLESTTYPGTTEEVVVPLLEHGNPSGLRVARDGASRGFYVAFSP
jgi:UDP-N-acetyl-D-glucosamine dehydrogenase